VRTQTLQAAGARQQETHAEGSRERIRRAVHVSGKTARPVCAHVRQLAAQAEAHCISQNLPEHGCGHWLLRGAIRDVCQGSAHDVRINGNMSLAHEWLWL
jgi:hypothetical protein